MIEIACLTEITRGWECSEQFGTGFSLGMELFTFGQADSDPDSASFLMV